MLGLIDVHSHHYPDSYLDACRREDSGFTHYYRDDGTVGGPAGRRASRWPFPSPCRRSSIGSSMMDEAGVDVQVISVSAPERLPASGGDPGAR